MLHRHWRTRIGGWVIGLGLVGSLATTALAEPTPAAAIALPILTDFASLRSTTVSITNTAADARWLRLTTLAASHVGWLSRSESCRVTAGETTEIAILPTAAGGGTLSFQCTTGSPPPDEDRMVTVDKLRDGILFVSTESQSDILLDDVLTGQAVVTDPTEGTSYTVEAIPYPGGGGASVPFAGGERFFRFAQDYGPLPGVVETDFPAPTGATAGVETRSELILFSLDGTTDRFGPRVRTTVEFRNDDLVASSNTHVFDCFDIVPLQEIDLRFLHGELGTDDGHLALHSRRIEQRDEQHDGAHGDGDGVRNPGVDGWLVVKTLPDGGGPPGPSAVAVPLVRQPSALDPSGSDAPTLAVQVPEPSAIAVLSSGWLFLGFLRRRRSGRIR